MKTPEKLTIAAMEAARNIKAKTVSLASLKRDWKKSERGRKKSIVKDIGPIPARNRK